MEPSQAQQQFLEQKGLHSYTPHVNLKIEKNRYTIKVASTLEELISTFELRYQVYGPFYKDKPPVPLDIDEYDQVADHIIILEKTTNRVLGTYRVLCSDFTSSFYTEREFNLNSLKAEPYRIVEMGRATVSPEARSGVVINLLWRGLGEYISKVKADYLIGCATFWTQDFNHVAKAWKYFDHIDVLFPKEIIPLTENRIPNWKKFTQEANLSSEEQKDFGKTLPPLIKSYIKAGSKFGIEPAHDKKLQSLDFFAICKVSEMAEGIVKKYL